MQLRLAVLIYPKPLVDGLEHGREPACTLLVSRSGRNRQAEDEVSSMMMPPYAWQSAIPVEQALLRLSSKQLFMSQQLLLISRIVPLLSHQSRVSP